MSHSMNYWHRRRHPPSPAWADVLIESWLWGKLDWDGLLAYVRYAMGPEDFAF